MPLPGNSGFWYPTHWSDLAAEAFVQAPADHDSHGFGADFVARQVDRDRALEDYLNGLTAAAGGIQGDMADFTGSVNVPTGIGGANINWTTKADSIGTSITLVGGVVQVNKPGAYTYFTTVTWGTNPTAWNARARLRSTSSFGGYPYDNQISIAGGDTTANTLGQFSVFAAADIPAQIIVLCTHNLPGTVAVSASLGVLRLS